ncbi:hypothetical protein AKJ09_07305 [Labilithrix luteola]|uniref:PD-(D/E)XK endonuclease-like domain-containing protein n=1 Tax=Labilithrix luteola TaxID=1391654 RepID=A0A0K1Q4P6_9BACT|nr:PD-(D/E)XK nuclease family protein [Labilithrix luteola]AKV00642.1 hypothetical protein AKJ09_07305 [Labilithrix luteola]
MDRRSLSPEILTLAFGLACALALLVLLVLLGRAFSAWRRSRRARWRARRAVEGEARAARWLADQGYRVLGAQVEAEHAVHVDGEPVLVGLRADYVVERDGHRFVVDVKTGSQAPRIETPATRRQLLEYRVAFDVDGVLLVDAEEGRIHTVTFPRVERAESSSSSPIWLLAAAALAVAVFVLTR